MGPSDQNTFRTYWLILVISLLSLDCMAQFERELIAPTLSSEAPILRFEKLGIEDGLAQGDVSTIFQDKQGFIWIMGTN